MYLACAMGFIWALAVVFVGGGVMKHTLELSDQELKIIQFIRSLTPEEGKLFEKHCLDYGVFLITRKRADQYNISCQSDHVC